MRPDNPHTKVFGSIVEGATYISRPAAYAVIQRASKDFAVVKTRRGYFLPGGGSLPGERPEETVHREVREELARKVRIIRKMGTAVQYFPADGRHYRMEAVFFAAEFTGELPGLGEYPLHWIDPNASEGAFFHPCHQWAVGQL
jgi:8-oxo-dGTP pyrophosphatase MutT (NUDIX family)